MRKILKHIGKKLQPPPATHAGSDVPLEIGADDVVRAYLIYLGRPPENDAVIDFNLDHFRTWDILCAALKGSQESRDRFGLLYPEDRPTFSIDDIDDLVHCFHHHDIEKYRGHVLRLPDWFDRFLDPEGSAYRDQMLRLWSAITGRASYDPTVDEDTPEVAAHDFLYRPGFYANGDAAMAGAHLIAIGHILLRSNLPKNGRVLEYGAGFGQTAFNFARLGAKVDVVDVNPAFVRGVNSASEFLRTDLTSYQGTFGVNPAGEPHAYDVILFYESFHHCLDAALLIEQMKDYLKPGGTILLAGEPISTAPIPEIPFPWGFRIDWENIAVMRQRGWMELGFQQPYLYHMFERAGFKGELFTEVNSHWAQVYRFTRSE